MPTELVVEMGQGTVRSSAARAPVEGPAALAVHADPPAELHAGYHDAPCSSGTLCAPMRQALPCSLRTVVHPLRWMWRARAHRKAHRAPP